MPSDSLQTEATARADEAATPAESSIGDKALRHLRADIISARLPPGAKLTVKTLTQRYGIGISPLREALAQLVGSGLVCREAQRGFRVAMVSREDLRGIGEARKLVELAAFEISLECMDEAWVRRVSRAHARFCEASDGIGDDRPISESWEQRHRDFHFALLSNCSSPALLQLCADLHDRFDRYRRLALPKRSFMGAIDQDHEELLEAALAGRSREAAALLGRHIDDTVTLIDENFSASMIPRQ